MGLGEEEAAKAVEELAEGDADETDKIDTYLRENYASAVSGGLSATKLQVVRIRKRS